MQTDTDIIVIGGGHAGAEAALVAARMGAKVILVTAIKESIARMPCNPSIGGLAKSHLVFELDALGGEMGFNADLTSLQEKTLNTSRGPAVQATRAQCDKSKYTRRMQQVVAGQNGLTVLEDVATDIIVQPASSLGPSYLPTSSPAGYSYESIATGIRTDHHGEIMAKAIILTAGTSLHGRIFIGNEMRPSGGDGRPTVDRLLDSIVDLGFTPIRLKTGTPPRLKAETCDFSKCRVQPGEHNPPFFSLRTRQLITDYPQAYRPLDTDVNCSTWNIQLDHSNDPPQCSTWNIPLEDSSNDASQCSTWNNQEGQIGRENSLSTPISGHVKSDSTDASWGNDGRVPSIWTKNLAPWPLNSIQMPCFATQTTPEVHEIIRSNLDRSALYGGMITGTGVRYCPSIEDKIVRFKDAQHHHVILEPEDRAGKIVYPNGLSNSLPRDVQERMVHAVPGLEKSEFLAYGYAIEYSGIDARELKHNLESKRIGRLFFAGQVNGTTGYEEAAAQGIMAGINAVLTVRHEQPLILSRQDAYIGVMIDDLVTKGTDEPYRMFTSRAERRLILRQDNARYRLLDAANRIGVLPSSIREETRAWIDRIAEIESLSPQEQSRYREKDDLPEELRTQLEIRHHYAGYIRQESIAAERAKKDEKIRIPENFDYDKYPAIRYESREKLKRNRPETLAQAMRIPGVNPADIAVLAIIIKKQVW